MAKRKYTCPHCGRSLRNVCHTKGANYFECDECNLRYRIQNGTYLYQYVPTRVNKVMFKGVNDYGLESSEIK